MTPELWRRSAKTSFLEERFFYSLNLLTALHKKLEGRPLESFYASNSGSCSHPKYFEAVNHKLLSNKTGQYAWRPFQIIHPALYVELVHAFTEKDNWKTINDFFSDQTINQIDRTGMPIQPRDGKKSDEEGVSVWWNEVVQKSIELSLDYEYLYHTDIVNCYGSIYTHSIVQALHGVDYAKSHEGRNNKSLIGNRIDKLLQAMSYGETNGIPQGSKLMDFIAEIILSYSDKQLSKKIEDANIEDYHIIRHRDDYRIFVNNPQDAERIIKSLTEILAELGMCLNENKTIKSNNVVLHSLKADKLYWIATNNLKNQKTLQDRLFVLTNFLDKYPNAGSVAEPLQDIYDDLKGGKIHKKENVPVLISLITNIAYKNPRTYPVATAIISNLITELEANKRIPLIKKIKKRFDQLPYTGHMQLWLQRLTLKIDASIEYEERLCRRVQDPTIQLWHSDWLQVNLLKIVESTEIIDHQKIKDMDPIIQREEFELFPYTS